MPVVASSPGISRERPGVVPFPLADTPSNFGFSTRELDNLGPGNYLKFSTAFGAQRRKSEHQKRNTFRLCGNLLLFLSTLGPVLVSYLVTFTFAPFSIENFYLPLDAGDIGDKKVSSHFENGTKTSRHIEDSVVYLYMYVPCRFFKWSRAFQRWREIKIFSEIYIPCECFSWRERRDEQRSSQLAIIFIATCATVIVLYSSVGFTRKADKKEDKDEGRENNGGNVVVAAPSLEHAAFNVTCIKRRWECSSFRFILRNAWNGGCRSIENWKENHGNFYFPWVAQELRENFHSITVNVTYHSLYRLQIQRLFHLQMHQKWNDTLSPLSSEAVLLSYELFVNIHLFAGWPKRSIE